MKDRRKKERIKFPWKSFLKEFGINERMIADFLGLERRTIAAYRKRGSVPAEYFPQIIGMTKETAADLSRWVAYDLGVLQQLLGCTKKALADELETSAPNISNWQKRGQIPRTYLEKVREIAKKAPF